MPGPRAEIVIVSGLSGSGKTVALRAIEDCGYSCVDNLPPQLIDQYVKVTLGADATRRVAVGVDIRERTLLSEIDALLSGLAEQYHLKILFLEADLDTLVRRYKETRRPHPLVEQGRDLKDAVALEKETLAVLRDHAERIVDTSQLTPHQLRHLIMSICQGTGDADAGMSITLLSFGFKFGLPMHADLLFDVRFLPNPHFVPGMRGLTGLDSEVREFVLGKPVTVEFMSRLTEFLHFLIPHYRREGKAYLVVGIGCTGGRHRSTAIAEEMALRLRAEYAEVHVAHRDLEA